MAYPSDFLSSHEPRRFEHAHVLFDASERDPESLGQLADRGIRAAEPLENSASCGVGQGGECIVEFFWILNHVVQYIGALLACQPQAGSAVVVQKAPYC